MNSHEFSTTSRLSQTITNQVRPVNQPRNSYNITAVTRGLDEYANGIWVGEKVTIPEQTELPGVTFTVSQKPTCQVF